MNSFFVLVLVTLSLTGCFKAITVTNGKISSETENQGARTYAVASSVQVDKASALIQPSATETQVVQAPLQGTLAGLSINVGPGTLGSPTSLVIEAGVSLSETSVVSETALAGDIRIENASQGIVIRPTEAAELRNPLKISLPLPALSSLQFIERNYAVYFKYLEPETGRLLTGLLAPDGVNTFVRYDEVSQRDVIQFNGYFGSYWVVQLSRAPTVAEVPMIKETKEAIINKSQVSVIDLGGVVKESAIMASQVIPPVVLEVPTLTADFATRLFTIKLSANLEIVSCVADIYEKSTDLNGASYEATQTFFLTGKILNAAEHTLTGRFRCIDKNGKSVVSAWAISLNIPGLLEPTNETSNTTGTSALPISVPATTSFISTWKTDNPGDSSATSISLPLVTGGTYNFNVSWGDGTADRITNSSDPAKVHTYGATGNYKVTITGTLIGWSFAQNGDAQKIINISAWGPLQVGNSGGYFSGSSELTITATDTPSLIGVTNLSQMFQGCTSLTTVPGMNTWDVSSVTNTFLMFNGAINFNENISGWNTASVVDMSGMFNNAGAFNQNIGGWNVSSVVYMSSLFWSAHSFNQDLNNWDVSHVVYMDWVFANGIFNHPLDNWDTSSVQVMGSMFTNAHQFNQDISSWDVSAVTNMQSMFSGANVFNADISGWNVSSVTDMRFMFYQASAFDQDIGLWDVSSVTSMFYMFSDANAFDQNLGAWDVSSVTDMQNMFAGKALSQPNYDALLTGWSTLSLKPGVSFHGGTSRYSSGQIETDRLSIITNFGWTITDGGVMSPP